jgi:uncharacterized protein (TIGR03118 family)
MSTTIRRMARAARTAAVSLTLGIIAACGGGGGYGGGTPPPPAPSGLSYSSPATTTVGVAMTALNPTVTGTVVSYGVSPALPAGISINTSSGSITGTPATATAQATYTVTATNATGSTTFGLALKVDPPPPSAFTLSPLVSDGSVTAPSTDAHLKNPWGMALLPGGPMWVANNHDQSSTIYDGTGLVQGLVVGIPAGVNGLGNVTGMVSSASTTDFTVTNGTVTAPARFLFATETGTISGWAPSVDGTHAKIAYDNAAGGAVFKGLAIANNGTANFLYAADFHNNRVVVLDRNFALVTPSGGFTDSNLPAGFAPFGIQAVLLNGSTVLVVTYAKQDATATDDVPGAGQGLVNIFDLNGTLQKHLVSTGAQLNSPWGVALAPATFGTLSNALLVGNFGDGKINAFNATSGDFIGAVSDSTGAAIVNSGLWGIAFGNGARNQPASTLYLTAGVVGETGGLYARIDLGATRPDIVAPTGVAVTGPVAASTVNGTVAVTANASDNVGVVRVDFTATVGTAGTPIGSATTAPFSVNWNSALTTNGPVSLTARAFDAFGNSTNSAAVAVTVLNVPDTTLPTVSITAPVAGNVSGSVTFTANASDNVGVAQVRFLAGTTVIGTDTTAPYSVTWDSTTVADGAVTLTAEAMDGAGNVATATLAVTASNAPTLATLQSTIFGPKCSGCHTGVGAVLPGSMNLSNASATFASLVNVTSGEVSTLKRVTPGDPNNSYVIQKLEGTASVGARMPAGGPFLDQATINGVRAWIQAGAAP